MLPPDVGEDPPMGGGVFVWRGADEISEGGATLGGVEMRGVLIEGGTMTIRW